MNSVALEGRHERRPLEADADDDPYLENRHWEVDRSVLLMKSEKRAWRVAAGAVLVAIVAIAAVFAQGPLRRVETVAIVVDKLTGAAHVETRLSASTIPALDALDMHNAATFIRAREGYSWQFLQRDYDMVMRMSTPQVFGVYNKQFATDDDLSKKFGSVGEYLIQIVNVRLPPGGRSGNKGEAVVTFDKTTKDPTTLQRTTQRYVATLRFEYQPKVLQKETDRIENPFGFIVTAYRADQELTDAVKATS